MAWWLCIMMEWYTSIKFFTVDSHLRECCLRNYSTKFSRLPYQLLPWQQRGSPVVARHKCDFVSNGHMLVSMVQTHPPFVAFFWQVDKWLRSYLRLQVCTYAHTEQGTESVCFIVHLSIWLCRRQMSCRVKRKPFKINSGSAVIPQARYANAFYAVLYTFSENKIKNVGFFVSLAYCHPSTTKPSVRTNAMRRPQRASVQQMIALCCCCCLLIPCPSEMGMILLPATSAVSQHLICHKIGS